MAALRMVLMLLVAAVAPSAAQGQWLPAHAGDAVLYQPFNSVAFAVRRPPPGRLSYLQAIRFIDDGMKYFDRESGFFVSPFGEICFRVYPNTPRVIYDSHYSNWCMYPQHVGRVEAMPNKITNINEVRLWCARPFPQCARRIEDPQPFGSPAWVSNSVSAASLDYREQRAALQDLIYLMGGTLALQLELAQIVR